MRDAGRDRQFERLYTQLLARAEQLHQSNKRRIRRGLIGLIVLPFILCFILWVTGSSKIVFLIIWVIIMFVMSAYLITIEYIDDFVQKTLNEMSEKETDLGDLLEREPLQERIAERLSGIRSIREDLRADIRARITGGNDDDTGEDSSKQIPSEGDQADFYLDTDSENIENAMADEITAARQAKEDSDNSGFDEAALLAVLASSTELADEAGNTDSNADAAAELQAGEGTSDAQGDHNESDDRKDQGTQTEEAGV